MASRALCIAIEEYPHADSGMLNKTLPGIIQEGLAFKKWLETKWREEGKQPGDTQLVFCSHPPQPGHRGADFQDILDALEEIKLAAQRVSTDEFYLYFSGHGFRWEENMGRYEDVLVMADFRKAGHLCLRLDHLIHWLRKHLGPGKHFHFIDACRNLLTRGEIQVGDVLPWQPNLNGEATTYLLQSTAPLATAAVDGGFTHLLLRGLSGHGRAKVWQEKLTEGMVVRYDTLRTFLKSQLQQSQPISHRVEGEDGESDAVFAKLNPPPESLLTVRLDPPPQVPWSVSITRNRTLTQSTQQILHTLTLPLPSDSYRVDLRDADATPKGSQDVDAYEDSHEVFFSSLSGGGGLESMPLPMPERPKLLLSANIPQGAHLEVRGIDDPNISETTLAGELELPQGRYQATLRSADGTILRQDTLEEACEAWTPGAEKFGVLQEQLTTHFPGSDISPELSESLGGPMDDPDAHLWLTLVGGGRILGSNGLYQKIGKLPLLTFHDVKPDASGIYLLVGVLDEKTAVEGKWSKMDSDWRMANTPPQLPNLRELFWEADSGPTTLAFRLSGQAAFELATYCLPNRITLIVLTLADDGNHVLTQYLLPLGHLSQAGQMHLGALKQLGQMARAFQGRKRLEREFPNTGLSAWLTGNLNDPIATAMLAYESLRRGDTQPVAAAVQSLRTHFPGFPDTEALASLISAPTTLAPTNSAIPLFSDGWQALRPPLSGLPDLRSTFTLWSA